MGRFLLFAFNNCFPNGGWNDYLLSDDDIQKIVDEISPIIENDKFIYKVKGKLYDQIQLVDKENGNILQLEFKINTKSK